MSGLRNNGNLFNVGQTTSVSIPSSKIDQSQPLEVTVYPIAPAPGFGITLDPDLTLRGNSPGLPIFASAVGTDNIFYTQVQPNTQYEAEVEAVLSSGPYLLEVSSENNGNDFIFSAPQIGNLSSSQTFNGFVGRSDPDDWLNFRLPSDTPVTITLSGLQDNANLELYEAGTLNLISRSDNPGTIDESITENLLGPENYLLRVTPANTSANLPDLGQASTEYTLTVTPGNSPGNPNPPGNGVAEDVLRFWNFTSLSHIFTANQTEIDDLTGQPNFFRREGNEFDVPINEGEPVYRYRNSATGTDLLTFDSLVADFLPQYRSLGVAFNAYTEANRPENSIPIYRLKNLNAEAVNPLNITHFFTSDPFNRQLVLDTLPFGDEGVGFWALPSFTDGLPA
ncbi:MAG: PPC domain-containing protein [Microcoleaceae cyanobacterium]